MVLQSQKLFFLFCAFFILTVHSNCKTRKSRRTSRVIFNTVELELRILGLKESLNLEFKYNISSENFSEKVSFFESENSHEDSVKFINNKIPIGSDIEIKLLSHSAKQTCNLEKSNYKKVLSKKLRVFVFCQNKDVLGEEYDLSFVVSGLEGSLILKNNKGEEITVSADGEHKFLEQYDELSTYEVSVQSQPEEEFCHIKKAKGEISPEGFDAQNEIKIICQKIIRQVVVGDSHSCLLKGKNNIYCWGDNSVGQLAHLDKSKKNNFFKIGDFDLRVKKISAGAKHNCALLEDKSVWCWGLDWFSCEREKFGKKGLQKSRKCGTDQQEFFSNPKKVELNIKVEDLALGARYSCFLINSKKVTCFGNQDFSHQRISLDKLEGKPNLKDYFISNTLSDLEKELVEIVANTISTFTADYDEDDSTKMLRSVERKRDLYRRGFLDKQNYLPKDITNFSSLSAVEKIFYGTYNCVYLKSKKIACWEDKKAFSLQQIRSFQDDISLSQNNYPDDEISHLVSGPYHSCLHLKSGKAACWGDNLAGQLGLGQSENNKSWSDSSQDNLLIDYKRQEGLGQIAAGSTHTCTLSFGKVQCWGENTYGQLGFTKEGKKAFIIPVDFLELSNITVIAAANKHTCSLSEAGEIQCWGKLKLEEKEESNFRTPIKLNFTREQPLRPLSSIVSAYEHTCAHNGLEVFCWGKNTDKQVAIEENKKELFSPYKIKMIEDEKAE